MRNKGTGSSAGERSKVRVVLVEFEGGSGDLQQLAQTLANAVRPQPIVPPVAAAPPIPALAPPPNGPAARDLFSALPEPEPDAAPAPAADRVTVPRSPPGAKRKPRTPSVVEEIDFTGQPQPFKEFMAALPVEDHGRRYLRITQWFKEHRQTPEIGADHVYTCYKFLGWPVPEDVTVAFRNLKRGGAVASGSSRGTYRITHIGENMLTEARRKD